MGVGGLNLLAGIITTVQQFLKITQLTEGHRVSSISWDKFYRNIKTEISKHPSERMYVNDLLHTAQLDFDRLMETCPIIPNNIIELFKKNFINSEEFGKVNKPEICNDLISTNNFRNPWYEVIQEKKSIEEVVNIKVKEVINEKQKEAIDTFVKHFVSLNNREPTEIEIVDNLKDKYDFI